MQTLVLRTEIKNENGITDVLESNFVSAFTSKGKLQPYHE